MPQNKPNPNAGHRERMKQRYLANGLKGFQPHEIIELLLFFSIPRCDTNKIAHELIDQYGSIEGVLNAEIEDLCKLKGVGMNSAILLHLMPDIFKAYQMSRNDKRLKFKNTKELKAYLESLYTGDVEEKVHVLCFDASSKLINVEEAGKGSVNAVNIDVRTIAEIALRNRASSIAIAHNHPDGDPTPSNHDVYYTNKLQKALRMLDIELTDNFIVGKTVVSMREHGCLE